MIDSNRDYTKQLAKQPGWQDVLTKMYVKESYTSHEASLAGSSTHGSLDGPGPRSPLSRDQCLVMEDVQTDSLLDYQSSRDEEEEEDDGRDHQEDISEAFSGLSEALLSRVDDGGGGGDSQLKSFTDDPLNFKPFDPLEQVSRTSSFSNAVDLPSLRLDEEGLYHPLSPFAASPFEMDLGGMGEAGTGTHTPAGSQAETPSPLDGGSKSFPLMRTRKSSSLSNVLDDSSYGTDLPPADTISNTSNPQVGSLVDGALAELMCCKIHSNGKRISLFMD